MRARGNTFSFSSIFTQIRSNIRGTLGDSHLEPEEADMRKLAEFIEILNGSNSCDTSLLTTFSNIKYDSEENVLIVSKLGNVKEAQVLGNISRQVKLQLEGILTEELVFLMNDLRVSEMILMNVLDKLYLIYNRRWTTKLIISESYIEDVQSTKIGCLTSLRYLSLEKVFFKPNTLRRVFFRNLRLCKNLKNIILTDITNDETREMELKLNLHGQTSESRESKIFMPRLNCCISSPPGCILHISNSGIYRDLKQVQYFSKFHLAHLKSCEQYAIRFGNDSYNILDKFPYAPKLFRAWEF